MTQTTPRLAICTPTFGHPDSAQVSLAYLAASRSLSGAGVTYLDYRMYTNCDLVRARSRAVAHVLESDATHVLFWDADVVPRDVRIVQTMIEAGKDVIALPYPRKKIDYELLADAVRNESEQSERGRQTAEELEAAGTEWPIRYDGDPVIEGGMARVTHAPCGFMMIRRECLERMVAYYGQADRGLTFRDSSSGPVKSVVALFMLMIRDGTMMSEDFSFCQRWRDLGGDVWALLEPADHIGPHRYRGRWQSLVGAHV